MEALDTGQAAPTPDGQATPAPDGQVGGAPTDSGTSQQPASPGTADPTEFFDYNSIADQPELVKAYKQMQASLTQKSQGFADQQGKIDLVDQFNANPEAGIRRLAQQYGINLGQEANQSPEEFSPQNWGDVSSMVEQQLMQKLQPFFQDVHDTKKQSVEMQLDTAHPDWRQYESEMTKTLKEHPTLSGDIGMLYRMSVPSNLLESRATAAALAKLKGTGDAAHISSSSSTSLNSSGGAVAGNFNEAVQIAKAQLAKGGVK